MLAVFDIGSYNENVALVLKEAGKYFALLVLSVLAIRLWRRWGKSKDSAGLICSVGVTALAMAVGYISMRQSLGSMYSYYGMQAFRDGRLPQALALFETAGNNWNTADVIGRKGVCLLLLGHEDSGRNLIAQARTLRKADSQFEDFYEGVFLFTKNDTEHSIPLLAVAGRNDDYRWSVVKIFAVIYLEADQTADAAKLMEPFMHAEVTEPDQAYILASLALADGKKSEAKELLARFSAPNLPLMWQGRYEKLRAQLGD